MKRYGVWKYCLIISILCLGLVYSLPNIYSPNPAVQISYNNSSQNADETLKNRVIDTLFKEVEQNIISQVELSDDYVIIKLSSTEEQLEVKRILSSNLIGDVIVALNLAPTTPDWLKQLSAQPMKLGLDLRGGVHFLMEVDTKAAVTNRQNGVLQDLRRKLREEEIRYSSVLVEEDQSISLKLNDQESLDNAKDFVKKSYSQFEISSKSLKSLPILSLYLSEEEIAKIESDAIDQNLTTLRNRVNELGVSEPIVQRQGKRRIVVQLPGIQDTAEAKKILGKTATLEFHLEAQFDTPRTRKTTYSHRNESFGNAELQDQIIIGGDQVATAQASFDENGMPQVNITLDGQGGARMHRATRGNIGKRLGVLFVEQKTQTVYKEDDQGNKIATQTTFETKKIISFYFFNFSIFIFNGNCRYIVFSFN